MNIQHYSQDTFMEMNPMHDAIAEQIVVKGNDLIITYDNLDISILGADGLPYHKGDKLTVQYSFDSFCDALFYRNNESQMVDLLSETDAFYKLTNNCKFRSYKFAVDSFKELTLYFNLCGRNEYWNLEISMDAKSVSYSWE